MNRRRPARSVIGVLMVLVAATLGMAGVVASAIPRQSYSYDLSQAVSDFAGSTAAKGVDEQGVPASGVPSRRGVHSYDDRSQLARACAHLGGQGLAPNTTRLAQDIRVSPMAPRALPLNRPVGASASQNQFVQSRIASLQGEGATAFRVNQQQINVNGVRVGINRPDLQYTLNGQRFYEEFDTLLSTRGPGHASRIGANDPFGIINLFTVG